MVKISIDIDDASARATLGAITRAMGDRMGLHGGIAKGVQEEVQDHLLRKYVPRNKHGDFWADVREGVSSVANDSSATVSLNELGIDLRYNGSGNLPGGGVTPGKSISSYTGELTRALAVPSDNVPIDGGRQIRPGRAGLLAFVRGGKNPETVGYLVEGAEKEITRGKNKGSKTIVPKEGGLLLYTLRTITRHRADKNILPPDAEISAIAREAAALFINSFEPT